MKKQPHKKWTTKVSKKVAQLDKETDKVLFIYDSIYAAIKALGKGKEFSGAISNVCNKKLSAKSAFGFKWAFIKK
jgi:sulfur transfer complex TusBCD TusB component (DsrH family)